ncbi:MAG: AI-2E family transporter, partial [Verrucomicrobia bacterium]|nr:AI-2E family transporter [Verrucomicrobiota bacterium]
ILISLFLAIIISFILVMDWQRIVEKMKDLEQSRIRTFYLGAAPHLIAFADVLGKALRAQAIIAVCGTILTAAGLWLFGVPNIALLSTIVFFCGFIPILGAFLSSIPILLFGAQVGGLALVLKLIALVALVNAFEAYVLTPRITAKVLRVHPILVLILILVGERFFGIWGMVVGVPIGYYVISVLTEQEEGLGAEP